LEGKGIGKKYRESLEPKEARTLAFAIARKMPPLGGLTSFK
jgi:hypothetical protein